MKRFFVFLGWLIMSTLIVWLMAILSKNFSFPAEMPKWLIVPIQVLGLGLVAGTAECWRIIRDPLMKN